MRFKIPRFRLIVALVLISFITVSYGQICAVGEYDNASVCTPCDAGSYCPGDDAMYTCGAGTYTASTGQSACTNCNAGQSSSAGDTSCTNCNAGEYSTSGGTCTACGVGEVSSAGSASCTACNNGEYPDGTSSSCLTCAAGTYSVSPAASCSTCAVGSVSSAGSASCTACADGEYPDGTSSSCLTCAAGTYSVSPATTCTACGVGEVSSAGSGSCTACADGEYPDGTSSSCLTCAAGTYSVSPATTCTACGVGEVSSAGSASCTACNDGEYPDGTSSSCLTCAAGTYSVSPATSCTACNTGEVSSAGSASCSSCTDGQYPDATNENCLTCAAGTYSVQPAASCTACNAGEISGAGASACTTCGGGTYSDASNQNCLTCPANTYSTGGTDSCTACGATEYSSAGSTSCIGQASITNAAMTAAAGAIVTETGSMTLTFDTSGMLFADGDVITLALDPEMSATTGTPACTENLGEFTITSCTYNSGTNTISMTVGSPNVSPSSISITVGNIVYPNSSTPSYPVSGGATLEVKDSGGTLKGDASSVKITGVSSGTMNSVTITPDPANDEAGQSGATIQFDLDVGHNVPANGTIEIYLPPQPVSGNPMVTSPTCASVGGTMSASLSCSFNAATNILTLTNLLDADSTGPLSFSVSGVTNPISTEPVTGITVNTYHSDSSLIDAGTTDFTVNAFTIPDLTWTQLDTTQVSLPTDMQFEFTLDFPVEAGSYIEFIFPDDVPIDANLVSYIGSDLFPSGSTFITKNQTTVIVAGITSDLAAGSTNTITFSDILNPQKIKPTDSIQMNIYTAAGYAVGSVSSGVNIPDTSITGGVNTINNVLASQTSVSATGVSWTMYFNPESPLINNSTDQAKIIITIPPSMTLDPTCTATPAAVPGQIDAGITCTAVNGGADNKYELTIPFGTGNFTPDLLADLGVTVCCMTNPDVAGTSEDIIIETYITDGGVDWLVDTGNYTVCITNEEIYYWDFTELAVQGSRTYSPYDTNTYGNMVLISTATPTQNGNYNSQGYIGETTDASMCIQTSDASYNTGTISFAMYIYITDLTTKQYLYCKNLRTGSNFNRGFCMGLNGNNEVFTEINTDEFLGGNTVETQTTALTYILGWNYIGCYSDGYSSTGCFNIMPDGATEESAVMTHTQPFVDDDGYYICVGANRPTISSANTAFFGMVNEMSVYSCPVSLADVQNRVTYSCDNPCPSCLTSILPTCIETADAAYIGKWDFTSANYQTKSNDDGPNDLHFSLLDDQTNYDPVYVDNQGLYFDGTSHIRTTSKWTQSNEFSMTYEGWIRPLGATLEGTLLEWEINPGEHDASISFVNNELVVDLQNTTVNIPITYANDDSWQYIGVSIEKIDTASSRVCVVYGNSAESCSTIAAVITNDSGGNTLQVGKNFRGMIKDFNLLDWPKRDYEFSSMVQTSGCTAWNGVACSICPSATGQCISTCEKTQYGDTCLDCLSPNCWTCFDSDYDTCFSCLPDYDFTYSGQSCPGICGNGLVEAYLDEYCDDGNTDDHDGCSSQCVVEPGWSCSELTPTSPSICSRNCDFTYGFYYGYHECQDGNNDALDGCFECKIERGWKCEDGSPWNPDVCTELCGDGINYGEHECDDGNNIDGDGCSALCVIENPGPPKWLCMSGNEKAKDMCHEWCGDGFRHEDPYIWGPRRNLFRLQEVTCDDGNLRSGEGCDGLCRIEEGFTCAGGSATYPDVCNEECGDRRFFHYDQCDDGNLATGDGCNAQCLLEAGFECLNGTPERVTDCDEICGDNINMGWHTCDDGNLVDGDGCSSTCVTEARYRCEGGDNDEGDACTELCGDGFNDGLLECDDKNVLDGDGCSSGCLVEDGWSCSGGSATTRDVCVEFCGDGLHQFSYECDDGNNDDGDGCSSTCYIESGWDCLSGDPSYCYKSSRPSIISATINNDSTKITIVFNTTILFTSDWELDDWRIEMFGPKQRYEFSYSIPNFITLKATANNTVEIEIVYDKQLYGYDMEYIILTFINRFTTVESTYNTEMIDTQYTFTLHGREVSNNSTIETMGTVTFILFLVCSVIFLTAGILGYSIGIWFDVYANLQLVHLFPLARLYMPTSLFKFFKAIEFLNFQKLNIGFWYFEDIIIEDELHENGDATNYNFEKMGFNTSSFFYTSQDAIMFIIYIIFFPVIVRVLSQLFHKSKFIKNFESKVLLPFLPFVMYISVLIFSLTSILNAWSYNVSSGSETVGTAAAFSYILFLGIYLTFLSVVTILYWRDLKRAHKKAFAELDASPEDSVRKGTVNGFMFFMNFRTTNAMYYWYPVIFIVRRILVAAVLVVWKDNGFDQLLALTLLSASMLVWLTAYQPFRTRLRNICASLLEFSYLCICMLIFPYVYPDIEDDIFESMQKYVVGIFLTVLYGTMLAACIVSIVQMIKNRNQIPNKEEEPPKFLEKATVIDTSHPQNRPEPDKNFGNESRDELDESAMKLNEKGAGLQAKPKGGLETEGSQTELESEEEESESDDSDSSIDGNAEDYSKMRNIPQAQVNLDDGMSTGFSMMRENMIQKSRDREKKF